MLRKRHHLVVLHESYLRLMLSGRKRLECRLSSIRRPPFQGVSPGDLLWFKLPSGPIRAVACAGECLFRQIRQRSDLAEIVKQHGKEICAADGFFEGAANWARYVSLIRLDWVLGLGELRVFKSDQRAWVPLEDVPRPGMRVAP